METCLRERSGLRAAEIFQGALPEALATLEARSTLTTVDAGEPIYTPDLTSELSVYVVIDGSVGIYRSVDSNRRLELAEIGPGGSFGEFSVVVGAPHSASAEARAPTTLARIPADAFMEFLHNHPEVALNLLRKLVGLVRGLDDRLVRKSTADHATTIVFEKLLRFTV